MLLLQTKNTQANAVAENKKYTKIEEPRYECQMRSHKKINRPERLLDFNFNLPKHSATCLRQSMLVPKS